MSMLSGLLGAANPKWAYHGTTATRMPAIVREGLGANSPGSMYAPEGGRAGYQLHPLAKKRRETLLFFTDCPGPAAAYATDTTGLMKVYRDDAAIQRNEGEGVLLRFKWPTKDVRVDQHNREFAVPYGIRAEDVQFFAGDLLLGGRTEKNCKEVSSRFPARLWRPLTEYLEPGRLIDLGGGVVFVLSPDGKRRRPTDAELELDRLVKADRGALLPRVVKVPSRPPARRKR